MCKLLLDRGADIHFVNKQYVNSLYIASKYGHVDVCRLLLDRGADIQAVTINGANSLYVASERGHVDVCRLLLDRGADIQAVTFNGANSLYVASERGHVDVCRLLLDRGLNIHFVNRNDVNSLYIASQRGHVEVCKLLLERGASVNKQASNRGGLTALGIACRNGHTEVCRLLLGGNADVTIKSHSGKIAVDYAKEMGHTALSRLLQEQVQDDVSSHRTEQVYKPIIHPKESQVEEYENEYDDSTIDSIDQITIGFQSGYDSYKSRSGKTAVNSAKKLGSTAVGRLLQERVRDGVAPHRAKQVYKPIIHPEESQVEEYVNEYDGSTIGSIDQITTGFQSGYDSYISRRGKTAVDFAKKLCGTAESRLLQERVRDGVLPHQDEQVYKPIIHPEESQVEEYVNEYDGSTIGSIDQITTGFQSDYDS